MYPCEANCGKDVRVYGCKYCPDCYEKETLKDMENGWKRKISKHTFSDEDVRFQFATDDGVCLEFEDPETGKTVCGILDKGDVLALAQRLDVKANDLLTNK